MANARVSSKGQITLPKSVLERLSANAGDQIEFVECDQGGLLRPISRDIRTLKGIVPKPTKTVSIETMNLALAKMGRP